MKRIPIRQLTLLRQVVALGILSGLTLQAAEGEKPSTQGVEFFEKHVRPLLVKNCYDCHGPGKQKGELRLDWRGGWARGGESGPAIVPGDPKQSLLIEAVRYAGFEMPPSGKLKPAQIAVLEKWIKMGAPDPREVAPSGVAGDVANLETGRKHWAYQPVRKHAPPDVKDPQWPRGAVDQFMLASMEKVGLAPAEDAKPQALVRRLYFDLTGLPPTPEQIDAFEQAAARDWQRATENLVDELLASPRFGERWGRHWLDVARYGESVTLRGFVFPQAWRYRDYVIDAFNRDLPYDRFVQEQIAGDLLPAEDWQTRQRQMTGTTFLMLGNTNFEEQDKKQLDMDVVDEQLDAIGKAFLAQTIACARCHDHKFDPIPTKDYYALAGILRSATALEHSNVSKWVELPLPIEPRMEQELKAQETLLAALEKDIKVAKSRATKLADAVSTATEASPDVLAAANVPGVVVDSSQAKLVGEWQVSQHSKRYIGDGYLHDMNKAKGSKTITFQSDQLKPGRYEVRLAYSPGASRSTKVPLHILHADGETDVELNQQQQPPIDNRFASLGQFRFEQNQGYVLVSNEGTTGHVTADAVQFLPLEGETPASGKSGASGSTAAASLPAEAQRQSDELKKDIKRMEQELKQLKEQGPQRPMVMTLREEGKFKDVPIHIRGSVHTLGEMAPRGYLQVATSGEAPSIPDGESGRRQLGQWLVDPAHPLTARVMVNRVWHWMFGSGLVRTNDNFGTTGEAPSHPELLDDLAARFIEQGWSVKRLIRELALSRTYQLASQESAEARRLDPENELLSHAFRQRLEAESLRDAMLQISGQLDNTPQGATFPTSVAADYAYKHTAPCRSVFVPAFRNSLPDIFEVFDYPDPSMVTGRRNTSTVATQALFMMNHPFVREQAALTAQHLMKSPLAEDAARVDHLYRLILGRGPTAAERTIALDHVRVGEEMKSAWATLVQTLFASPDFRYVE